MSRIQRAVRQKRLGREQIDKSRESTPIRDALTDKGERNKARLLSAKEGVRNTLEATRVINRLKRFRDSQHTDRANR